LIFLFIYDIIKEKRKNIMFEFNKDFVILEKDEYECLKKEASLYDPAPWCKLGICEGICKECKDTCPTSIYTEIREKVIVDFLVSTGGWVPQEAEVLMRKYMTKTYGIEYNIKDLCVMCGVEIPEGRQVCPACENKLKGAIQNS
jgi:ferredoxin